jgi:hypothetical protein
VTLCEKEDDDVSGSPAAELRSPMIFANYETAATNDSDGLSSWQSSQSSWELTTYLSRSKTEMIPHVNCGIQAVVSSFYVFTSYFLNFFTLYEFTHIRGLSLYFLSLRIL